VALLIFTVANIHGLVENEMSIDFVFTIISLRFLNIQRVGKVIKLRVCSSTDLFSLLPIFMDWGKMGCPLTLYFVVIYLLLTSFIKYIYDFLGVPNFVVW